MYVCSDPQGVTRKFVWGYRMSQPVAVVASTSPFHPHFQGEIEKIMAPLKQRTYQLMGMRPGDRVLDVGCGPASDTIALADRVGPEGFVIGVDSDKETIAEAERRAIAAGVGERVRHRVVNTLALPFKANEFDSARSERTFQYIEAPEVALGEMIRVTKAGGRIVVADVDWGAGSLDTPHPYVAQTLEGVLAQRILPNGYSGRTLQRLMRSAGLDEVKVELHPFTMSSLPMIRYVAQLDAAEQVALADGYLSAEQIEQWREDLEEAAVKGWLFASVCMVVAVGVVP